MIDTILIRFYTPHFEDRVAELARLVRENTDFRVEIIDHTGLTLDDFDLGGRDPVSIDLHIAHTFAIPYLRVSRVFETDGRVMGRKIIVPPRLENIEPNSTCIIDSDMVTGGAVNIACRILRTDRYSVPLRVKPNQDLIDIEDLLNPLSLCTNGTNVRYIHNESFFVRRTSLPRSLYQAVRKNVFQPRVIFA